VKGKAEGENRDRRKVNKSGGRNVGHRIRAPHSDALSTIHQVKSSPPDVGGLAHSRDSWMVERIGALTNQSARAYRRRIERWQMTEENYVIIHTHTGSSVSWQGPTQEQDDAIEGILAFHRESDDLRATIPSANASGDSWPPGRRMRHSRRGASAARRSTFTARTEAKAERAKDGHRLSPAWSSRRNSRKTTQVA